MNKLNNTDIKFKKYKIIGIMSGTSVDGIDLALLETNGDNYVKRIIGKSYKYKTTYQLKIKKYIGRLANNYSYNIKYIDNLVTINFYDFIIKFLKEYKIKKNSIDYIGLSGQTVLHKPHKKISIQLGLGKLLAKKLKINVVSNFRDNDLLNGGQGAPIGAFYNKYLSNIINNNILFINIGGITNFCYSNKKKLIAYDVGPGNALIDDFLYLKVKKTMDKNGSLAFKGKTNKLIINKFVKDKFFKMNYPKSLDREYFKKYLSLNKKLSIEDTVNTLAMMTVMGIIIGLKLIKNFKINKIILTGGGRKNLFIYKKLKFYLNYKIIQIEKIGLNGDLLEAEAFAYLAARSINKLPLSIKTTTGVNKKLTGGKLYKYY